MAGLCEGGNEPPGSLEAIFGLTSIRVDSISLWVEALAYKMKITVNHPDIIAADHQEEQTACSVKLQTL
ncbi:hypothetical protein ANN_08485 [Periplaneta americana]|uniref:Per a allergen n=1 Tax=Periplaneta americana TaxID=6978 RepID=A0ABQ8T2Q4_PERAM|nr:hypothetical protein ANN_08485 [Periplaneta americana]